MRHAFVLGSGIAGLSVSEILLRNGWRVTLLEASHELGGSASRATQNWFHTGWLYAALPSSSAMRACHSAVGLYHSIYDSVLGPEVLNLKFNANEITFPQSAVGWFGAERVHYLYAINTSELSALQRLTWGRYLDAVPLRRLRHLGYRTERAPELAPEVRRLLNYWEGGPEGYKKYAVILSTDAHILTHRVMDSLLALLGQEAEIVTGAAYQLVEVGERSAVRISGETLVPDLLVLASGQAIPKQLEQLGKRSLARLFRSIRSPIVVLDHALALPNFIRFTARLPSTVNHMKYSMDEGTVHSTLGSYDYYPAGEEPDIAPFTERICKRLNVSTRFVLGQYYGTKTEFTGDAGRRYNHAVERVNENTYFAIPGKFSQFPLMVHDLANKLGLQTQIGSEARHGPQLRIAPTMPECIAAAKGSHKVPSKALAAAP